MLFSKFYIGVLNGLEFFVLTIADFLCKVLAFLSKLTFVVFLGAENVDGPSF